MIPDGHLKAVPTPQRLQPFEAFPSVHVHYDQFFNGVRVNQIRCLIFENILVDGEKRLDIGVDAFGDNRNSPGFQKRHAHYRRQCIKIRIFMGRYDNHSIYSYFQVKYCCQPFPLPNSTTMSNCRSSGFSESCSMGSICCWICLKELRKILSGPQKSRRHP